MGKAEKKLEGQYNHRLIVVTEWLAKAICPDGTVTDVLGLVQLAEDARHAIKKQTELVDENDQLAAENEQLRDRVRSFENVCAIAREKASESPVPSVRGIKVPLADEPAPSPGTDIAFLEMPGWLVGRDPIVGSYLKVVTEDGVYAIKLMPWRD